MKSLIRSVVVSVGLSCSGAMPVRGQEPPAPPVPAALPTAEAEGEDLTAALAEVQQQVEIELAPELAAATVAADAQVREAQQQIGQQLAQVQRAVEQGQFAAPAAGRAPKAPVTVPSPAIQPRLHQVVRKGRGGSGRALVIRTSDADAKAQANLEEDLAVMSRIFDNALDDKLGRDQRGHKPFGIDVFFAPGSSSPIRSLFLEGYGALFLLNVNFPLLPPDEPEQKKEKSETDSTWERAKRELNYGSPDASSQFNNAFELSASPGPEEEYDENKVEDLKEGLFEALKNATNIRNLKPDETITVCVFGGVSSGLKRAKVSTGRIESAPAEAQEVQVLVADRDEGLPARGTIMTIRVKKSDADAFAKDKLSLDDFRKKASVTTYAGDTTGWGGSFGWGGGVGGRAFSIPRIER